MTNSGGGLPRTPSPVADMHMVRLERKTQASTYTLAQTNFYTE